MLNRFSELRGSSIAHRTHMGCIITATDLWSVHLVSNREINTLTGECGYVSSKVAQISAYFVGPTTSSRIRTSDKEGDSSL